MSFLCISPWMPSALPSPRLYFPTMPCPAIAFFILAPMEGAFSIGASGYNAACSMRHLSSSFVYSSALTPVFSRNAFTLMRTTVPGAHRCVSPILSRMFNRGLRF